jgi:NDP-sugar pyrophosphorylase family protein
MMEVLDPEGEYKVKALLPFLGRRVIDWQLEALRASPYVGDLYLLGLEESDAKFDFPVHYVPVETISDFPDKLVAGLRYLRSLGRNPEIIVISSSDSPALRTETINAYFKQLEMLPGYDFVLSLVPEQITEEVFPRSGRVVARFTDHQVFPGELYALSAEAIERGYEVIHEFNRRRRWIDRQKKQIALTPILAYIAKKPRSWPAILKFLLKRATLQDAEKAFSIAFDCLTKGVIIPDPGFGMDMDLPEDYERLKAYVVRMHKSNQTEGMNFGNKELQNSVG